MQTKQFSKAEALLQDLLRENPDDREARTLLGKLLAELLLAKGYEVYGTVRRSSSFNTGRIDHIYQDPHDEDVRLRLVYADLSDASSLNQLVKTIRPDETYNLGAQSHVRVSFDIPEYTSDIAALGCTLHPAPALLAPLDTFWH